MSSAIINFESLSQPRRRVIFVPKIRLSLPPRDTPFNTDRRNNPKEGRKEGRRRRRRRAESEARAQPPGKAKRRDAIRISVFPATRARQHHNSALTDASPQFADRPLRIFTSSETFFEVFKCWEPFFFLRITVGCKEADFRMLTFLIACHSNPWHNLPSYSS